MRIVAIVQARMGSTRLPGKVLKPILGKPMLGYIIERLKTVKQIDDIWVATSTNQKEEPLVNFCKENGYNIFEGSETDVLDRFYRVAVISKATEIIRITGDCPLIDPTLIAKLIDKYITNKYDHCGIATGAGAAKKDFYGRFPDGLDAEIFSFKALEKTHSEGTESLFREHVTPYMWKNPSLFKLGALSSDEADFGNYRWTVDNEEDLKLVDWIYSKLYREKPNFDYNDIIKLVQEHPEQIKNGEFIGKEGYEEFWQ